MIDAQTALGDCFLCTVVFHQADVAKAWDKQHVRRVSGKTVRV